MLLQVMALARDVADDFEAVGQTHLRNFAQRRVRLLRRRRIDARADAALLRRRLKRRRGIARLEWVPRFGNQLIDRRHRWPSLSFPGKAGHDRPRSPSASYGRTASALFGHIALALRAACAQNEIAPSARLRQGALPFGRPRCGKAPRSLTSKSDRCCQWQRLSFIRRGDAPVNFRENITFSNA